MANKQDPINGFKSDVARLVAFVAKEIRLCIVGVAGCIAFAVVAPQMSPDLLPRLAKFLHLVV